MFAVSKFADPGFIGRTHAQTFKLKSPWKCFRTSFFLGTRHVFSAPLEHRTLTDLYQFPKMWFSSKINISAYISANVKRKFLKI